MLKIFWFAFFQITWLLLCLAGLSLGTVIPASKDNTHLASTATGSLIREARDYGGSGGYPYQSFDRPQSRCISCLYAAMTGQDQNRYSLFIQTQNYMNRKGTYAHNEILFNSFFDSFF